MFYIGCFFKKHFLDRMMQRSQKLFFQMQRLMDTTNAIHPCRKCIINKPKNVSVLFEKKGVCLKSYLIDKQFLTTFRSVYMDLCDCVKINTYNTDYNIHSECLRCNSTNPDKLAASISLTV